MESIKRFFKLEERGTTVSRELVAGLTTFLAMAYILFVNPIILGTDGTGMEPERVFTATVIAAVIGTLIMGLLANYPVALAPGMGMNAFFTFTVVLGLGYTWQQALAGVFISGIVFIILSISGIREKIINAIPQNLKYAVGAGIGMFIAFIGLQISSSIDGIIVGNPDTLVDLGNLSNPHVLLTLFGLLLIIVLYLLRVKGAIIFGMIGTAIVGLIFRGIISESYLTFWPSLPKLEFNIEAPHFLGFVEGFGADSVWDVKFFFVIFIFLFVDFFDTAGTLVTVGERAGLFVNGELKDSGKALLADSTATVVGAIAGTSSTTSYVESLSGIEAGGRTGLTSVFTAIFFALALFLSPLLSLFTAPVTAPVLIFVGILMASQLGKIEWGELEVAIPAFLTILAMPLTYSVADGIAIGFIFYPITMALRGRRKEVHPIMFILGCVFILYFVVTSIVLH